MSAVFITALGKFFPGPPIRKSLVSIAIFAMVLVQPFHAFSLPTLLLFPLGASR